MLARQEPLKGFPPVWTNPTNDDRHTDEHSHNHTTHKDLEHPHGFASQRVLDEQEQKDVDGGEEDTSPERERGEEQTECDAGAEQLGEVGGDDAGLGDHIERVEHTPSDETAVFVSGVEEQTDMGGEICSRVIISHKF
jgi:hypothetical protein